MHYAISVSLPIKTATWVLSNRLLGASSNGANKPAQTPVSQAGRLTWQRFCEPSSNEFDPPLLQNSLINIKSLSNCRPYNRNCSKTFSVSSSSLCGFIQWLFFLSARCYVYKRGICCLSVGLSVCPTGIATKLLKLPLIFFHHLIAPTILIVAVTKFRQGFSARQHNSIFS